MAYIPRDGQPGVAIVRPKEGPGKRRQFGATASIDNHLVVCVGYTEDGKYVCYVRLQDLEKIRGSVRKATSSWRYRLLRRLMARYEGQTA